VGVINAINAILHVKSIHQEELEIGAQHIMRLPRAEVTRDEGMPAVPMHGTVAIVAEVETVKPFAVRLIVLEPQKWNRAHIDRLPLAIRRADVQRGIEIARLCDFEAKTVFVVLTGHVEHPHARWRAGG